MITSSPTLPAMKTRAAGSFFPGAQLNSELWIENSVKKNPQKQTKENSTETQPAMNGVLEIITSKMKIFYILITISELNM